MDLGIRLCCFVGCVFMHSLSFDFLHLLISGSLIFS